MKSTKGCLSCAAGPLPPVQGGTCLPLGAAPPRGTGSSRGAVIAQICRGSGAPAVHSGPGGGGQEEAGRGSATAGYGQGEQRAASGIIAESQWHDGLKAIYWLCLLNSSDSHLLAVKGKAGLLSRPPFMAVFS